MWVDIMWLLRDDDLSCGFLSHKDVALDDGLRTRSDNEGCLALNARGIGITGDTDLTVTETKGRL
jgi:hypothetical protein